MKSSAGFELWLAVFGCFLVACEREHKPVDTAAPTVAVARQALTPPPVVVSLDATADTQLVQCAPTFNYGSSSTLKITGAGLTNWEAGLVQFNPSAIQSAVGDGTVVSAVLTLKIDSASLGWGNSQVSVSRMSMPWTENGATWLCANDTNNGLLGQFINDCSAQDLWGIEWWSLFPRPYAAPPTAVASLPFGAQGTVSFDVTTDVNAFLGGGSYQGWFLSSTAGLSSVWVRFRSRETGDPPKLTLTVQPPCVVTGPDTTCNGEDDDCNGLIDDGYVAQPKTCGVGACASTGQLLCVNGSVQDTCVPGTPAASDESCNGVDDDCNGSTDDGYVAHQTTCGVGACSSTGTATCVGGTEEDSCTPGTPALTDTTCNREDEDCDGTADESYNVLPTSCGIGACASSGSTACVDGTITDSCTPAAPPPDDSSCTAGFAPAAFDCPSGSTGVCPRFLCIEESGGSKLAVFEVVNGGSDTVTLPIGADNTLSPAPQDRGQPTVFEAGTSLAFTTPIADSVTWQLGEGSAQATLDGPPCSATGMTPLRPAPVVIRSHRNHDDGTQVDGEGSYGTGLAFEIPERLRVTLGNAGNGTAELVYTDDGGASVTCTYRGGSSVASPIHELDRALGRYYHFVSCSNGALAGTRVIGTNWTIHVLSGDPEMDTTEVELQVGPGCSGELDPPIWPEDTVAMREQFNWENTTELPTTDSEGLPAMRYALIYVESLEQVDALTRMHVYFRPRPLFTSELERYRGKCGTFGDVGDNRGQFVFAFIPATFYNYFRNQALASITQASGPVDFRAIILRPIPETSETRTARSPGKR